MFIFQKLIRNGTLKQKNGEIYEGDYILCVPPYTSHEKCYYKDMDYEIEIRKHGDGKTTYPNGDIFEGKYNNDKLESGIMRYKNGDRIIGTSYNNNQIVYGEILCTNGDIYEGEIKDNKKHGYGIVTYKNGDLYIGNFDNDQKDGLFMHINNGNIITAMYHNDILVDN